MRLNPILLMSLALGLAAASAPAHAGYLVQGSTYDLTLENTALNLEQTQTITFNGQPTQFNFGNIPVTVTTTDTAISNNSDTIAIVISANQDIFPSAAPGDGSWYIGIGVSSSPMQLTAPVTLTSAFLSATIPPPNTFPIYYQFVGLVAQTAPWDGTFLGNGGLGGFVDATGDDIEGVELDLTVVPEPASVAVFLAGLTGLAAFTRKRRI